MQNKYYAAKINDEHIKNSSSGGVFYSLASKIIEEGGVVFGAAYNENFKVIHKMVEDIDELIALQGSKYVQSDVGDSFKIVLWHLNNGRKVLFSGTPCQVVGLYNFLNLKRCKGLANLLTVEIVCHGVPSGGIFKDYIATLQKEKKLKTYEFRSKDKNKNFVIRLEYEDGQKIYKNALLDPYYAAFLADLTIRQTCYKCKFCGLERKADITLGDFWGVEKVKTTLKNTQSASLVVCNSEYGLTSFERVMNSIDFCEVTVNEATKYQPQLCNSVREYMVPKKRDFVFYLWREKTPDVFFDTLKKESVNKKKVVFNYIPSPLLRLIKRFIQ